MEVDINHKSLCNEWQSVLHFAMQMCRKHGIVKDRVTLVTPTGFLQIVQLCQAQVQKRMGKGFQADEGSRIFTLAQSVYSRKQGMAILEVCAVLPGTSYADSITSTSTSAVCTAEQGVTTPRCNSKISHIVEGVDRDLQVTAEHSAKVTPSRSSGQGEVAVDTNMDSLTTEVLREYDRFLTNSNHVDAVDVLKIFLLELVKPDTNLLSDDLSEALSQLEHGDCSLDPLQDLVMKLLASRTMGKVGLIPGQSPEHAVHLDDERAMVKGAALWPDTTPQKGETETEPGKGDQVSEADISEEGVHEVMHSYLQLLVNTRSELALATVFNSPDRGLTHQAFTCLKHMASTKNMSLYQTAMSLMTKLHLGGSGYAPDPKHQLLQHVKGLTMLCDLMNTLQQLLEDIPCIRSSVLRVVRVVSKRLIGCKSGRYRRDRVEAVSSRIQRDLGTVVDRLQGQGLMFSPDKPACQGGSLTSRRPRRVLLHYLDQLALDLWPKSTPLLSPSYHRHHHLGTWLKDVPFGPHTPPHFPSVLSQFRSPPTGLVASPVTSKGTNRKGTPQRKRKMTVSTNRMPDTTEQSLLERCSKRLCDTVIVLPSKTIVHPAAAKSRTPTTIESSSSSENHSLRVDKENCQPPHHRQGPNAGIGSQGSLEPGQSAGSSNGMTSATSARVPLRLGVEAGTGSGGQNLKKTVGTSLQQTDRRGVPNKAPGKKCRRRLLSLPKEQRSITSFFCL